MMGWYGGGGFGASWMFMGAFWLVFAGVVGWLVVRLSHRTSNGEGAEVTPRSALELLDRRFASGEIDADSYRAQRAVLLTGPEATR